MPTNNEMPEWAKKELDEHFKNSPLGKWADEQLKRQETNDKPYEFWKGGIK